MVLDSEASEGPLILITVRRLLKHGDDGKDLVGARVVLACDDGFGQHRVNWELGHASS